MRRLEDAINNNQINRYHSFNIQKIYTAPPTSFEKLRPNYKNTRRIINQGYFCIQIGKSEFFISSSENGILDFSNVLFKGNEDDRIRRPNYVGSTLKASKQQYYNLEFQNSSPGDLLNGKEPIVTTIRAYFVKINQTLPKYELDLSDLYCIDGDTKAITKCQVEMNTPCVKDPSLRIMRDGQLILGDETFLPSYFVLNYQWWSEKIIEEEILARSKRTERYITLKLRGELNLENMNWQGRNIGPEADKYLFGGDFARNLEALGRYKTGLNEQYGNVWHNKPYVELDNFLTKNEQENRLIRMSRMDEVWQNLKINIQSKVNNTEI